MNVCVRATLRTAAPPLPASTPERAQDRIQAFWAVTQGELAEARAARTVAAAEAEAAEDRHGLELTVRRPVGCWWDFVLDSKSTKQE